MMFYTRESSSELSCMPEKRINEGYLPENQKLLTVLLGTYTFIFIGCGSLYMERKGEITMVGVALGWGCAVVANIYTFGHISGAHINPALTFAYAVAGQFPWKQVPLYVVAELFGSTAACLTLRWIFSEIDPEVMLTQPVGPNPASDIKVMVIEIIITFMYAITSCGSRSDSRAYKELGGVAVGATVFIVALVAGKISGAALNPARSLGPAIIINNYNKIWIYIISPVIGAVSATTLYFFHLMPKASVSKIQDAKLVDISKMNKVFTNYSIGGFSVNSAHLGGMQVEKKARTLIKFSGRALLGKGRACKPAELFLQVNGEEGKTKGSKTKTTANTGAGEE